MDLQEQSVSSDATLANINVSYTTEEAFPDLVKMVEAGVEKDVDILTSGLVVIRPEEHMKERYADEMANMFYSLSDDNQVALRTIFDNYIKLPKDKQADALNIFKNFGNSANQTLQNVEIDAPIKRRKRSHSENTVRRNYSLSETIADAIQDTAKSKGITASLYVEDVMARQPSIIESLKIEN